MYDVCANDTVYLVRMPSRNTRDVVSRVDGNTINHMQHVFTDRCPERCASPPEFEHLV